MCHDPAATTSAANKPSSKEAAPSESLFQSALTAHRAGHIAKAEAAYRFILAENACHAEAHYLLGLIEQSKGNLPEAEGCLRRALELKPDFPEALNALGVLLDDVQCFTEAEAAYRRVLTLLPDSATVQYNLALLLLRSGRYTDAWKYYESRYDPSIREGITAIPRHLPFPQWQGERLVGKSMVIWADEGYGDQIQFARYVPLLRQRGVSRITLVCDPALKPLLETVDGVDCVMTDPFAVPPHDYWSLFMSVPRYFGTTVDTIPASIPYVSALKQRLEHWQRRLPVDGMRVGLVWKGNPQHGNDAHRSLPSLATLAPLWSIPGITFIGLQKDHGEEGTSPPLAQQPLIPLGREIQDFADTAAIVAQLDLIICVDTAIAHVAGALGKPCWVLLPSFHTDWRWLTDRSDSPWYPENMRLFRQTRFNDWTLVIEEVANALQAWALTCPHPNRCATD